MRGRTVFCLRAALKPWWCNCQPPWSVHSHLTVITYSTQSHELVFLAVFIRKRILCFIKIWFFFFFKLDWFQTPPESQAMRLSYLFWLLYNPDIITEKKKICHESYRCFFPFYFFYFFLLLCSLLHFIAQVHFIWNLRWLCVWKYVKSPLCLIVIQVVFFCLFVYF